MKTEELYNLFQRHPKVSTDSRTIAPGSIFFALKGPRFNGNEYAGQALRDGAAYAVIDDKAYAEDERCLLVPNVLSSLQNLAWHHRNQLRIPVIGITGSNGKTTTKELMAAVLARKFNTLATKGNLNNHIGVPLTLLEVSRETEMLIVEMGANHQKEIELLCSIARPTHGLITNIGKAHLEGFGSLEGVKKGKKELYDSLSINDGQAFVAADDSVLMEMAAELKSIIRYGKGTHCHTQGVLLSAWPHLKIAWHRKSPEDWETHIVNTSLAGDYNFENILAAICVGHYFGVPPKEIISAIEGYSPANNRSQEMLKGSNRLLLDAYNANPDSMKLALEHFATLSSSNKGVILGDMMELGSHAEAEHTAVIRLLKELGIEQAWLIGPEFYRQRKSAPSLAFFESREDAEKWFREHPPQNMSLLLKGSRSLQLEKLLPLLDA